MWTQHTIIEMDDESNKKASVERIMKFEVGDRVKVKKNLDTMYKGCIGKIMKIQGQYYRYWVKLVSYHSNELIGFRENELESLTKVWSVS